MSESKPYVRVTVTADQRRSRLRSLGIAIAASVLLLAVLLVASLAWFDGFARWALLVAAVVPLTVLLLAARGAVVLGRTPRSR